MTLDEFLENESCRNAWITDGVLHVYLRRSYHSLGSHGAPTFDIANVNSDEMGSGQLWPFVERCRLGAGTRVLYFECVNSPELAASLEKRGWIKIQHDPEIDFANSYYLPAIPLRGR